jgi:Flp pilus assembly protein TadB
MSDADSDSDLVNAILGRATQKPADRLEQQMSQAPHLKQQEETASRSRLEKMWTREHERQRAIAEAQLEQRRQERQLVRYVLVAVALLILIVIVMALLLSRSASLAPAGAAGFFVVYG